MVLDIEDYAGVSDFFAGFAIETSSPVPTKTFTNGVA